MKQRRYKSWNNQIFVVNGPEAVAGFYQRDNTLSIADVANELELCLIFDKPSDHTLWKPALLLKDTTSYNLVILDHEDGQPFPTPTVDEIRHWICVFHCSPQCTRRDLHSLEGI